MIPRFPTFKPIQLTDSEEFISITEGFPPYSDFNFVSLWSWNTSGAVELSVFNNNLIVRFEDYVSQQVFFSYIGIHEHSATAEALIKFAETNNAPGELRLVPEFATIHLDSALFKVSPDRDHFDYVYSTSKLMTLPGSLYATKRNMIRRFKRQHADVETKLIDPCQQEIRTNILKLFDVWGKNKSDKFPEFNVGHERIAITRFFDAARSSDLVTQGTYLRNEVVGFKIFELLKGGYSIGQFSKCDTRIAGLADYIMNCAGTYLYERGIENLNYEQDLGNVQLRAAKESFRPIHFFKKYTVCFAQSPH